MCHGALLSFGSFLTMNAVMALRNVVDQDATVAAPRLQFEEETLNITLLFRTKLGLFSMLEHF